MSQSDFIDFESGGPDVPDDAVFVGTAVESVFSEPQATVIPTAPTIPVVEPEVPDDNCSMEVDGLCVDDDGGFIEQPPKPTFARKPAAVLAQPTEAISPKPSTSAPQPEAPMVDFLKALTGNFSCVDKPSSPEVPQEDKELKQVTVPPPAPNLFQSQAAPVAAVAIGTTAVEATVVPPVSTQAPSPVPQQVIPSVAPTAAAASGDYAIKYDDIKMEVAAIKRAMCVDVLENPRVCDQGNVIHMAIWYMRHNPAGLMQMTAAQLCVYETALSAHQVSVQSMENEWKAYHGYLGREMDRVLRKFRKKYKGDTEKDREEACMEAEPEVANLRNEFLKAQALASALNDMGNRFAQLEDGLKRTISTRHEEEKRSYQQAKWQQ